MDGGSDLAQPDWHEADAIIGAGADDDYRIAPTAPAALYRDRAPAFAAILESAPVRIAAEDYERDDKTAVDAQRGFKRAATRANLSVLIIAMLGVGVLLLALYDAPSFAVLSLGIAGAVTGAYAAFLSQRLRQTRLFERWMSGRADAEERRREYFALMTQTDASATGPDAALLPSLRLEYFRRYHLEVQTRYYDQRAQQHQRESDRTATFGAFAVFLAALFTGIGGALGSGVNTAWTGLAALGVLGAALTSFATTRESISQDARNAERYARTHAALRRLAARIDEVRDAVAAGNLQAMTEFVAAADQHLSVEHRQWLSDADSTREGLAKLDEALTAGLKKAPE